MNIEELMELDKDTYGTDLRPMVYLKNDDIKITETKIDIGSTPDDLKKWAAHERNATLMREKNFKDGANYFDTLQKLDIELIQDVPSGWNLFDPPKKHELADLIRSIASVGLIYPIYVLQHTSGVYSVICGRSRLLAFTNLFQATGLDKYRFIPSYIIKESETDELFVRTMIIESNLRFRSISKLNLIQSLITIYEVMQKNKVFRGESNVAVEVAKTFEVSETTVFNYLKVRGLCEEALTLLYEDRLKLKAALYLTKVSKETQKNILEKFGTAGVNKVYKLKLITKEGNISLEELEEKIEELKTYTPSKTKIILEVDRRFVNPLLEYLLNFKKEHINPFANKNTRGVTTSVFRVRYDAEAMGLYVKQNIIDEITLKKLVSKLSYEKIG
ncbi:MAG: ParB/RepB/Spo0J family partition protein [Oscillospiraceae bacterium]|nr:ParB/RepB/Spo0J family partition protein [Oscillospiraceae bacterium]